MRKADAVIDRKKRRRMIRELARTRDYTDRVTTAKYQRPVEDGLDAVESTDPSVLYLDPLA